MHTILLIAAVICFAMKAVGVETRGDLIAAGFACLAASLLV